MPYPDALALLLDLVEEGVIPRLRPDQQEAFLAAAQQARALRALLLAGRVMVLPGEVGA